MRIALVSRTTAIGGGASSAAESLARELRRHGEDANLITIHPHLPNPIAQPLYRWRWLAGALARLQTTNQRLWGLVPPLETLALMRHLRSYDLVHFHDVWSAISPWSIRQASRRMPTVLTLHDCAPFTGGCLYMLDCPRYQMECGRCPEKRTSRHPLYRWDFSHSALMLKRRLLRKTAVALITPSHWMAARAAESAVFPMPATVIPNGCDIECFHPRHRIAARSRFNIDENEQVVLISAASLDDPRKGVFDAIAALRELVKQNLSPRVLLMGRNTNELKGKLGDLKCLDLGYLNRKDDVACAYAAADVFLFPSRADNCPLAVQESMASGTPVVAYDVGGVSGMIVSMKTGVLVPDHRPVALAEALGALLSNGRFLDYMKVQARMHCSSMWSMEMCVGRYVHVYGELSSWWCGAKPVA